MSKINQDDANRIIKVIAKNKPIKITEVKILGYFLYLTFEDGNKESIRITEQITENITVTALESLIRPFKISKIV